MCAWMRRLVNLGMGLVASDGLGSVFVGVDAGVTRWAVSEMLGAVRGRSGVGRRCLQLVQQVRVVWA